MADRQQNTASSKLKDHEYSGRQISQSGSSQQDGHHGIKNEDGSQSAQVSSKTTERLSTVAVSQASPTSLHSQAEVDHRSWTISDIGHNSIASVLNDPNSTSSQSALSGKSLSQFGHRIEQLASTASLGLLPAAIPKTVIKQIRLKDFTAYIQNVDQLSDRYTEIKQSVSDGDPILFEEEDAEQEAMDGEDVNSTAAQHRRQLKHERIKAVAKNSAHKADAISTIPSIFFQEDFNLQDPRTFDAVTEFANVTSVNVAIQSSQSTESDSSYKSHGKSAQDKTTNAVQQEKLSHYLDTVEVHLVAEISLRSLEFFSALSNIKTLQQTTVECLGRLRQLRSYLKVLSDRQAKEALQVVQKRKLRNTVNQVYDAICLIDNVRKTQTTIQILLNHGDYVGALDVIRDTENLLRGRNQVASSPQSDQQKVLRTPVYLSAVRGLVHLHSQLNEMIKLIGSLIENEFIDFMISDIEKNSQHYQNWAHKVLDTAIDKSQLLADCDNAEEIQNTRMKLSPYINGLIRVDIFGHALQVFRDRVMKYIKAITKQHFPAPLPDERGMTSDDGRTIDNALARRFKALSFDDFYRLLYSVFTALLMYLRKLHLNLGLLSEILTDYQQKGIQIGSSRVKKDKDSFSNGSNMSMSVLPESPAVATADTQTKYSQILSDVSDVLFAAADLAHVRCGKFLMLRQEQNTQLNMKDFFKLFDLCWKFIACGEEMSGNACIGLKGSVLSQAKSFVQYFHMERMKQLTFLIDEEKWSQAEVPIDFQLIVDKICNSTRTITTSGGYNAHSRTKSLLTRPDIVIDRNVADIVNREDNDDNVSVRTGVHANMQSYLVIDDKHYHIVPCALLLVKMLDEYLICIQNAPALASDVLNRIVDLAKFFNSKTSGIIVGGNAVSSSVLKSITAKHLALAGQSLGLMIALLPKIKSQVEKAMTSKQQQVMLQEVDKVVTDFSNNREQVYSRITLIMQERVAAHASQIPLMDWEQDMVAADSQSGIDAQSGVNSNSKDAQQPAELDAMPYMKALVKETIKLHKILHKYLFAERLREIFVHIFDLYNKKLSQEYQKLDIYSAGAKSRLLADVQYFITTLSSLDNVDSVSNELEVVVNNIRIKDKRERPSPSPQPSLQQQQQMQQQQKALPQIAVNQQPPSNQSKPASAANPLLSSLSNLTSKQQNQSQDNLGVPGKKFGFSASFASFTRMSGNSVNGSSDAKK
ncbi:hypothetical protein MP228_012676 [Amoeboaphelidium protococcarum]|nr:hypothetical protein MP228_012676 [Amoeboaphelidium protococcarum]